MYLIPVLDNKLEGAKSSSPSCRHLYRTLKYVSKDKISAIPEIQETKAKKRAPKCPCLFLHKPTGN